jgi:CDP-4-dehydro-6-deoxyglucose reductase, E1
MRYPLACETWDHEELGMIQKVINSNRFTMGPEVAKFEEQFAAKMGKKHAVMVNSGSSANLLMIGSLVLNDDIDLNPGDEVIVPAVSWSTTFFPVHQYGLTLKFVDVNPHTFNIDPSDVEKNITSKTKAVLAVNLLGNSCDYTRLIEICHRNNLLLLEDNCESLGAKYRGRYLGSIGLMGTYSFFFSHHMQTMEGGMILTDDLKLAEYCKSLRAHGWMRELPNENTVCNKVGNPFKDSFRFALPGYSVRPLEMSGAIGQAQLKKLETMTTARRDNALYFQDKLKNNTNFYLQKEETDGFRNTSFSSWFGFGIVLQEGIDRDSLVDKLIHSGIECRPIVAGNFMNNPVIERLNYTTNKDGYKGSNILDSQGFFIGNNPSNIKEEIDFFFKVMEAYL